MTSYLPKLYPRMFDFLKPGSFQYKLDPDLELLSFKATVSTKISPIIEKITGAKHPYKTKGGISINRSKTHRETANISWQGGTFNPTDYDPKDLKRKSWREIFEDLLGEHVEEAVLQERWAVEPPPRALEEQLEETGAEAVAYYQNTRPNYLNLYKRMLPPIKLFRPRMKMTLELMRRGIVEKRSDPRVMRIHGTLATEGLWLLDSARWDDLKSPKLTGALQVGMSMPKKFWRDTGFWHTLSQKIDNRVFNAQVYMLQKEQEFFPI